MANQINYNANRGKSVPLGNFMDLAKDNKLEQAMENARNYAQIVLEIVREPMVALDSDLKVISANTSFYKTFDLEPQDTEGNLIYELGGKQWDMPELHKFIEKILPKNKSFHEFEVKYEFPKIGKGVLVLNGQVVTTEPNGPKLTLLAIKNIPHHDRSSEEADDSISYIKETLETTDDGILVIDTEHKIKVFNQRFIEMFGISETQIGSGEYDNVMKFIIKQVTDSKRFSEMVRELNKNKSAESFNIIETNRNMFLEYYSKPQRVDEEIVGRVWSFRDITSRKWAEEALRITYISFHKILESSKDGIIVVDENGSVCFYNQAAEKMIQGQVDERLSQRLGFKITAEDEREIAIERFDGDLGVADMKVVETEWEGKKAYLAMLRDITDRKHAEEELKMHQEHLEEEVKQRTNELIQAEKMVALGQLVSGVAHEVNNPLAFIKSNTEFMKNVVLDLKNKFKEKDLATDAFVELEDLIKVNINGINRISLITAALKSFAKPGSEGKNFADINQGLKDTLLIVGNKLKHRINVHEDYTELPSVLCNIEQLNQVFMNIILNAAEAMETGNIYIKTWGKKGAIFIEIRDDGKGIPEDEQNKIFDPFFTTKDDGTGLGLSLSYRIIQAQGGNIKVKSKVGKGTKILIELPMVDNNDTNKEE